VLGQIIVTDDDNLNMGVREMYGGNTVGSCKNPKFSG